MSEGHSQHTRADVRATRDYLQSLVENADLCLCVSRDATRTRYDIRDVTEGPPLKDAAAELESRGMHFLGVAALRGHQAITELSEGLPDEVLAGIVAVRIGHLALKLASVEAPAEVD